MDQTEILKLIEQARDSNQTRLDLFGKKLNSLPPEIFQLTHLKVLVLGRNQLCKIPPEIGQLTNLEELQLFENQLEMLPPEIGKLNKLKELSLSDNQLSKLPPEIGNLTDLLNLNLLNNRLINLPIEIGKLIKLRILDLSENKISSLPDELCQLVNLNELWLYNNTIKSLPTGIGQLIALKILYLQKNQLESLIPEIVQLNNLKELDLQHNLLPIPPEILALTNQPIKIINYYFQHQEKTTRPLNEVKVLIVGQGGVGKTSLLKRLVGESFNPSEIKTEGIKIKKYPMKINKSDFRLNFWDFGGQEVMHATHQFFLTKRSLYILVLDGRQGANESHIEYWLKIIRSFGGAAPIIVVGNKCDEQELDLDWTGLCKKHSTIATCVKRLSCKTGEGISQLAKGIEEAITNLEHVQDELLTTWFEIKDRLEKMDDDYISYKEYQDMCFMQGITTELDQQTLIGFLHDLGIVLHYQDHPIFEDTNILHPEWVTVGVYQILNSNSLFQNKGILRRQELTYILDPEKYPPSKHMFIINMMRKFELCFDFDGYADERFLIPDLLSREEPDTGEWHNSMQFQYEYDVLPSSIISRFIVRMHKHISQRTYWRSGVVLSYEENKALVKADQEERIISIFIKGKGKRQELLAIIRAEFDSIHATITGIRVNAKVPHPDYPSITIDYKHLRTLENKGVESFIPEGLDEPVNVSQLLSGIELPEFVPFHRSTKNALTSENRILLKTMASYTASQETNDFLRYLDMQANKSAVRIYWLYITLLAIVWLFFAVQTILLGWNNTEALIALTTGIAGLGPLLYFGFTRREWSPKAFFEGVLERTQRKFYKEAGLD